MKNRDTAIPANRRNVERMAMQIENLQGIVNELLEENHVLKQRLVAEYDCAYGVTARSPNKTEMRGQKVWF